MVREIPLTQGKVALVDDDDYGLVSQFQWHADECTPGHFYAATYRPRPEGGRKRIRMHVLILDLGPGEEGDHINLDELDNRRDNLRRATRAQQMWNRRVEHGVSGLRGVERNGANWAARIRVHNKRHYIGTFQTPEEAARAYDEAARRLHGEFARVNFPMEGEQAA